MSLEAPIANPSVADPPPGSNGSGQPAPPEGAPSGDPPVTPALGGPAPEGAPPPPEGDDAWRQRYIQGDDTRLTELSRYKNEDDWIKSGWEARGKLSERAGVPELAKDATADQLAQYRETMGIAATPADYGLTAPDGYEVSEVEKSMLGEFADAAHAAHMPTEAAKGAVDFFFKSQEANQQANNELDTQRNEEWTAQHHKDLGAGYDLRVSAAESYLTQRFIENPEARNELLNARLPGGGLLHKNPGFIDMVSDLAMQNGFGDKIEANEVETAGGKPLAQQVQELRNLRFSDPATYDLPQTQKRLERLYELQLKSGDIDEEGNPIVRR